MEHKQSQLLLALYVQYGTGEFSYKSFCDIRERLGYLGGKHKCTIPDLRDKDYLNVTRGYHERSASDRWYAVAEKAIKEIDDGE